MKFKVEFDVQETSSKVTEQDIIDYLNYELGARSSISMKNPWCYVDMSRVVENLKVTKQI